MSLDVYLKEEIQNVITASLIAMIASAMAHGMTNVEHARGFVHGQHALATALGVDWKTITDRVTEDCGLDSLDVVGLLEPKQNVRSTES